MTHIYHPLYSTWEGMNQRCNNPNHTAYAWYGGRGISICERWESFLCFLADMGNKPDGCTLDRIDSNGNYEPSNCRWATKPTQARNVRVRHDNKSGLRGVSWFKRTKSWMVGIGVGKKTIHLGYYVDFFDACCVRKSAELHLWEIGDESFYLAIKEKLRNTPNRGNFKCKPQKKTDAPFLT